VINFGTAEDRSWPCREFSRSKIYLRDADIFLHEPNERMDSR
jgi:hypothetical protein